ncbi:hypothetical protein [Caballeronia choica]|uniref:hypothetical protein n=1 Tax=Caballeronia choica TaxID=326476 RepID=UPI0013599337|nr:hypothetical protein [Caballeronia choica]
MPTFTVMPLLTLTNQDPEMWADAVLSRMASEEIKAALEKRNDPSNGRSAIK